MPAPAKGTLVDGFVTVEGGVNSGVWPVLVKDGQVSFAVNATMRGSLAQNRPPFIRNPIDYGGDAVLQGRFQSGRFQGAGVYVSDSGTASLIASISGRLYQLFPSRKATEIQDVTISVTTTVSQAFAVPAVGSSVAIVVESTAGMSSNYEIQIEGKNYVALQVVDGTTLLVENVDDTPGATVPIGAVLVFWDTNPSSKYQTWMTQAERWMIVQDGQSDPIFFDGASSRRSQIIGTVPEIRAGKMGAYGFGRAWFAGPDGRTYFAADIVGSSSGTPAYNYRDSVLKMTENTYLNGGGSFIVPGNIGFIQGMGFVAILDQSLGQGPLQVMTTQQIFSCKTPIDRTEWASTENPIQTISQITSGTTSQWSISAVNGDFFYRAPDGWRSLILGRREFSTWGNTPQSQEMNRILFYDDPNLLYWASSSVFDNRLLMTCSPVFSNRGIYHRGLIALDFDVISSMRDKAPPVYDGLWTGLQVLQILAGTFDGVQKCYAFVLTGQGVIELWEVGKRTEVLLDANTIPTLWSIETGALFKKESQGGIFREKKLVDGELFVDDVRGRVDFQVFFRADQNACWTEWHRWSICADTTTCETLDPVTGCLAMTEKNPQSFPRMGFGTPPSGCDEVSNTPLNQGHTFQLKIQVQGWCRIVGMNVSAIPVPEQAMAPVLCDQDSCYSPLPSATGDVFANESQSYTATCPEGTTGDDVTVVMAAGTIFSTVSIADANAQALAVAQSKAESQLQCDPGTCWIESLASTTWRIASFNPAVFDFVGSVPLSDPWDGKFLNFVDCDAGYKYWDIGSVKSINNYQVDAFVDWNGCDEGGERVWTVWIQSPDTTVQYWTGTKIGGTSPGGIYTKDGGTSSGPETLIVEENL